MYHLINNYQNESGDALEGYFVRLRDANGDIAPIFSDAQGTPIETVSGNANAAVTQADTGQFSIYVADGIYDIVIYDKNDIDSEVRIIPAVPMFGFDTQVLSDIASAGAFAQAAENARDAAQGYAADAAAASVSNANSIAAIAAGITFEGDVVFDEATKTFTFPRTVVRYRGGTQILVYDNGGRFTVPMGPGSQLLYLDTTVAAGSDNPFKVGLSSEVVALGQTQIPIAHQRGGFITPVNDLDLQYTDRVERNILTLGAALPIIFVPASNPYGITGGSSGAWMIPQFVRYRYRGSNVLSIGNTLLTGVTDPTGTYDWSRYAKVDIDNTAENTLYLDVGANLMKAVAISSEMKGTLSGYVPVARYHNFEDGELVAMNGFRAIRAGVDPDVLLPKVTANETAIAALQSSGGGGGGSTTLVSTGERLGQVLTKLAAFRAGEADSTIKIGACPADSWWDRDPNGVELLARFAADGIPMASAGYISLNPELDQANGVVVTQSDGTTAINAGANPWTFADGSDGDVDGYLSGSGNALTCVGQNNTFLASNVLGRRFYLTYVDTAGAFQWRIDGGAWTTITGGNTGARTRVQLGTTFVAGVHTIEIDTTVNGALDKVHLTDLYADDPSATGVQFNKLANGESNAADWLNWQTAWIEEAVAIGLDLAIVALGINDQRFGDDPAVFETNMNTLLDAFHAALPAAKIIFVVPPRSGKENDAGTSSMRLFGDKYQALFEARDYTEIVRLDQLWGTYAEEDLAPSIWDTVGVHLDPALVGPHRRYIGAFYDPMLRRYL